MGPYARARREAMMVSVGLKVLLALLLLSFAWRLHEGFNVDVAAIFKSLSEGDTFDEKLASLWASLKPLFDDDFDDKDAPPSLIKTFGALVQRPLPLVSRPRQSRNT